MIRAISKLPIGPHVCFRSIIAWCRESGPREDSDDGVVPYRSAHLAGALSEKAIIAGHSVQQTPRPILEIRRILREDIEQIDQRGGFARRRVGEVTAEQPGVFPRRRGLGEIDQVSETFKWSARATPIHSLQITYRTLRIVGSRGCIPASGLRWMEVTGYRAPI
ncbi:hypothetical protein [Paraburkholderia sp. BR10954]|uniref:hypothetical protein n=1 Tax=Paraburkholderia sp. BR10954 TaxID=3236995 RepID=UPI0034D1B907